jgi:uncharacterized protein YeaO (DUF488 family)
MTQAGPFRLKRAYEQPSPDDGFRVLVDRLWPRGLTREKAQIDLWPKDIAPSDELRRHFHADARAPEQRWDDFRAAYFAELAQEPARAAADVLKAQARSGPVTLLYAAKDERWNNAVALKAWLEGARG